MKKFLHGINILLKGILFVILFLLIWKLFMCVLSFKYEDGITTMEDYYDLPADTVDVLMLGSSHIGMNIDTKQLWDEYGIASYKCWASTQAIWNTYYYLEECLKTQHPKVVLLDVYGAIFDYEYGDYILQVKSAIGMKPSLNKVESVMVSGTKDNWANMLLGFPTYHTRYSELTQNDFEYFPWNSHTNIQTLANTADLVSPITIRDTSKIQDSEPLAAKEEEYLRRIIACCKENGIALEMVASPYDLPEQEEKRFNRVAEIAEELDVPFVDYNDCYQELGIDTQTDFQDTGHFNSVGVVKYTNILAEKLKGTYELPDRRTDQNHIWNQKNTKSYDAIYTLPEQFIGDGKQNFIDTGIKLYENPLDSWTLLLEVESPKAVEENQVYVSCYNEMPDAYGGLLLHGEKNADITARFSGAFTMKMGEASGTTKLGIVKNGKHIKVYRDGVLLSEADLDSVDEYDGNLLIGCQENQNGEMFRFSEVTVHALQLYRDVMTDADVAAWSPEWPPMPVEDQFEVSTDEAEMRMMNRFVGDGAGKYYDTGKKLFEDPLASWTVLAQIESDIPSGDTVYLSCFAEDVNDYRGLLVRKVDQNLNILYGNGASINVKLPEAQESTLAIIKKKRVYSIYLNGKLVLDEVAADCNAYDGTLLVGAERDADGNLFRFSGTTINNLWVVDGVVSKTDILSWKPETAPEEIPDVGSDVTYHLDQSFAGNGKDLYVDTGVHLYDVALKSWTMHLQLDQDDEINGTILSCFAEDPTNYRGLMIRQTGQYTYAFTLGSAYQEVTVPPKREVKISIVRDQDNYTIYVNGEEAATVTNQCAAYAGPLMLGSERTLDGEPFRFSTAKIRNLEVVNAAETPEEVVSFWQKTK